MASAHPTRKVPRTRDPFAAIHQAVHGIKEAELTNIQDGLHHLQGRTDTEAVGIRSQCYDLREDRLLGLHGLLGPALLAGIDAGFSGEAVSAWLKTLMESVESAAYWDGSFEGDVKDDAAAFFHFQELFDQAREALVPLKEVAAVARWRAKPAAEHEVPDSRGDWEFAPGRFRYKRIWYDLAGQRLHLLEAFVNAPHMVLTHEKIASACSRNYEAYRPHAYVSELNSALRKLLNLKEKPVRSIPGEKAYRMHLPD